RSFDAGGFEWIDLNDAGNSVISFLRKGNSAEDQVVIVCNFTPVPRENYRIGMPAAGAWEEIFNTDWVDFGGSGMGNGPEIQTDNFPVHNRDYSVSLTLPPLGCLYLKRRN